MSFNGSANWGTWELGNWLVNDEGLYLASRRLVAGLDADEAALELREWVEDLVASECVEYLASGTERPLYDAVMDEGADAIDWAELVEVCQEGE